MDRDTPPEPWPVDPATRVTPTPRIPPPRRSPEEAAPLPAPHTSAPTRRLCTLVYVEQGLRDVVRQHFPVWRARAWAPCYGIDLIALLRHTRSATRLTRARDGVLTGLLLAVTGYIPIIWFGPRPAGLLFLLVVIAALPPLRWHLRRRKVSARDALRKMIRYARRHFDQFMGRALLAGLAVAALTVLVTGHPSARLTLAVLGAGAVAGWLTITSFTVVAFLRARRVLIATGDVARLGGRLAQDVEHRAAAISDANLLFYDRRRARTALGPFVGAGQRLARWTSEPVNVTVAKLEGDTPKPVDVVELHRRVAAELTKLALPHTRCRHRVYVDGRSEHYLREFRHGGNDMPPQTNLSDDAVLVRVAHPEKYQRGYLCLQAEEPDGDVVVTVFVRAIRDGERLQVEVSVNTLPEVWWPRQELSTPQQLLHGEDDDENQPRPVHVSPHVLHAVWQGAASGTRTCAAALLTAPERTTLLLLGPILRVVGAWRDRRAIERGDFDFGAQRSLREDLAMNQRLHYNAMIDMLAQANRLQRRVVDAVAAYLEEAGIDASDFKRETVTTIVNTQQNIINTINSHGGVTFGSNNTVNTTTHQQAAPSAGGQQPAPHHQERS